jgi:hypothetical protein
MAKGIRRFLVYSEKMRGVVEGEGGSLEHGHMWILEI